MLCPFKKIVTQEQTMPTQLATPEPPKVNITEMFAKCDGKECMAAKETVDGFKCALCESR